MELRLVPFPAGRFAALDFDSVFAAGARRPSFSRSSSGREKSGPRIQASASSKAQKARTFISARGSICWRYRDHAPRSLAHQLIQAQTALLTARARDPRNIPWRALIRRGKIEEPRQNETVGIAVVVEGRDDDRS